MADKTMTIDLPATEVAKHEAALAQYLERIDRILERSKQRHAEIDRLKKRTRATLAELKALR